MSTNAFSLVDYSVNIMGGGKESSDVDVLLKPRKMEDNLKSSLRRLNMDVRISLKVGYTKANQYNVIKSA